MKKKLILGFFIIVGALYGAYEGDYIPPEHLNKVGLNPSYNCEVPTIKGNITQSERIYHVPSGASYDLVKIEPQKGERLFCTEEEAESKGWRKSER